MSMSADVGVDVNLDHIPAGGHIESEMSRQIMIQLCLSAVSCHFCSICLYSQSKLVAQGSTPCRIETGGGLQVADIVQQLQGLPQLTTTDPLSWLGLEPWTPQWTPHCSWAPPPSSTPIAPHAKLRTSASAVPHRPGSNIAALPIHAGGCTNQGVGVDHTSAAGASRDAADHDCITAHSSGNDIPVASIEEQSNKVEPVCLLLDSPPG